MPMLTIVTTCIYEEMLKLNSKKYMWYLDKYFFSIFCVIYRSVYNFFKLGDMFWRSVHMSIGFV